MELNGAAFAAARAAWLHHDLLDERADDLASGSTLAGRQMRLELGDRATVELLIVRREPHDLSGRELGKCLLEAIRVSLQITKAACQRPGRVAILFDARDDLGHAHACVCEFALDPGAFRVAQLCRFHKRLLERGGEPFDGVWRQ
ncbi:hypothetical protein [Sphingomonas morindae]|uniref:Uncharacterized protein n=1 Tax=Sphingomonas morindae TaxID=1541170 RepID=A0ABY4X9I8_9SPHN|nr:hypothetical protein [Sphingomonas morindae]USI72908.1 hypothetical protein LHA26_16845 [Sphingomonas morindae]USI73597.1 hypothetical protein LHA26_03695 [Sphingomonas morindae]